MLNIQHTGWKELMAPKIEDMSTKKVMDRKRRSPAEADNKKRQTEKRDHLLKQTAQKNVTDRKWRCDP